MTVVASLDDPVRRNKQTEDRLRREWVRSQRLHQRPAAPIETTDAAWNAWADAKIAHALRSHSRITQDFVVSLIKENNKSLMKLIRELRTEIDQLRKQLEDKTHA